MEIKIQGDGNAIGNGNRIVINKPTNIYNKNGNGSGGPRKSNEDADSFSKSLAIVGGVVIALAVAAWKFAQYAPLIYFTLKVSVIALLVLTTVTTVALYGDQPRSWLIDQVFVSLAVILAGIGVWMSAGDYRFELTQLAQQVATWKGFICGLSPSGAQLATFHMFTMSMFAVPALLLAAAGALGAVARWGFFVTGFGFFGRVATIQNRGIAVASLIVALTCLGSQLDIGQAIWAEQFDGVVLRSFCRR